MRKIADRQMARLNCEVDGRSRDVEEAWPPVCVRWRCDKHSVRRLDADRITNIGSRAAHAPRLWAMHWLFVDVVGGWFDQPLPTRGAADRWRISSYL